MVDRKIETLVETSRDHVPWDLLLLADPSRKQIEKYIDRAQTFTLSRDGKAIAVIVLLQCGTTIEIMNVAVAPELQGCGIGKFLLNKAKEIAIQMGGKTLAIGTGNSSRTQLALYQKVGFRIESVDKDYFTRNYKELIVENGIICRDMIRLSLEL